MDSSSVAEAYERIAPYINRTPILESRQLNDWLGSRIMFKVEAFQKTGAFKFRGALNALLAMKEQGELPQKVVAFSSGNHSQAVACASAMLGVESVICIPETASKAKIQATKAYGAEVNLTKTRAEAEAKVKRYMEEGAVLIHPFDNPYIIAGQGTACYEALEEVQPDAIFATCGGGGWLGGSYLAKELRCPDAKVYAGEPALANDATQSYHNGKIMKHPDPTKTIADGARTPHVGEHTFPLLQKLDGFYEVDEKQICYWAQWLATLLKVTVEPTSAVAMGAAQQWLRQGNAGKIVLVLLSGGNMDHQTYQAVWKEDHLGQVPER